MLATIVHVKVIVWNQKLALAYETRASDKNSLEELNESW